MHQAAVAGANCLQACAADTASAAVQGSPLAHQMDWTAVLCLLAALASAQVAAAVVHSCSYWQIENLVALSVSARSAALGTASQMAHAPE